MAPRPRSPRSPASSGSTSSARRRPSFASPTLEQLGDFIAPTFQALIDGSKYVDPRLTEIFDELVPDVIVEDNVVAFPALGASGRPWVRIMSCNPAEMKDPAVAPFSSGYPAADRGGWPAFLEEVRRTHGDMWADFDAFCREHGEHGLSYGDLGPDFMVESPYLNLYSYPAEADYARERPLGPTWHRLDSTVRAADTTWELPEHLRERDGALIYLSLGSLGSADVGLMQRLVDLLATTENRVIVSKGPLADQITLHDNQTGEAFLPQPAILPQVDLVITHGGNNTVTEAFHHGKPMIVLPLFWDQVDNAQRVDETGLRAAPLDLRLPRRGADRRHRRAARRPGARPRDWRRCRRGSRPAPGPSARPTSSNASRALAKPSPTDTTEPSGSRRARRMGPEREPRCRHHHRRCHRR